MNKYIILVMMVFCHIVDDYYLQGWLALAKQRKWWIENAPNELYKDDYLMALFEHAFSWAFMINVPIMVFCDNRCDFRLVLVIFINMIYHAFIDNEKANKLTINLVQDQLLHFIQIFITWMIVVYL